MFFKIYCMERNDAINRLTEILQVPSPSIIEKSRENDRLWAYLNSLSVKDLLEEKNSIILVQIMQLREKFRRQNLPLNNNIIEFLDKNMGERLFAIMDSVHPANDYLGTMGFPKKNSTGKPQEV